MASPSSLGNPPIKEVGEPKEHHEVRLGAGSGVVLDIHDYVADFAASVIPACRRGVVDLELPTDTGVARSLIPPGTAAVRDFHGLSTAERLSLTGNPSVREDWTNQPDGRLYDFIDFCRREGRFAAHFARDGQPTAELLATRDDRLESWRTLQELAGPR